MKHFSPSGRAEGKDNITVRLILVGEPVASYSYQILPMRLQRLRFVRAQAPFKNNLNLSKSGM